MRDILNHLSNSRVEAARKAMSQIPEKQRLALVSELVSEARDSASRLQLLRIKALAEQSHNEIERAAFVEEEERRCR